MKHMSIIDTHAHFSPPRPQEEESKKGKQLIREINGLREIVGTYAKVKDTNLQAEALLADMEYNSIEQAWLHQLSFKKLLGYDVLSNDEIATVLKHYPGKFKGFAGVDPYSGDSGIDEIKRCIQELGFSGIKFNPNDYGGFWLNDRERMYPLMEACATLNVPVSIHTGLTPGRIFYMKHNDPILVDDLCVDFPEVTIIIEHMGYPWTDIAYDMVRRHSNTYLTITAIANILIHNSPKAFTVEFLKMNSMLGSHRILWGSDWTATPNTAEVLAFLQKLKVPLPLKIAGMKPFGEDDKKRILYDNARMILL
jgi:predicted TIM-barrel fold metal-dependent hydrolase